MTEHNHEDTHAHAGSSKRDMSALYMPSAIIIAAIIIGGGLYFGLSSKGADSARPIGGAPSSVNVKDVKTDGEAYVGKANAPLTMAYWSDYQCSYCKQFEVTVLPELMKKYVDTGKLKIVFKDFAFLGPDSTSAALYKHAVWDLYPSKFLEWNKAMYDEEHEDFGDEASILKLSATISGIDANKLKAQVAAKKTTYEEAIAASREEGGRFGVQGTPGFIVGKQSIDGAQPLANFISVIDSQLK